MGFGFDDGGGIGFFNIGGFAGCVAVDVEVEEDDMFGFRVQSCELYQMGNARIL